MKILGNRVLVSKIEEPKGEGFQTIEVQDSFVNKGKVEQIGFDPATENDAHLGANLRSFNKICDVGSVVLFAKYSPDTQEIEHGGKKMKIVRVEDILAVL